MQMKGEEPNSRRLSQSFGLANNRKLITVPAHVTIIVSTGGTVIHTWVRDQLYH